MSTDITSLSVDKGLHKAHREIARLLQEEYPTLQAATNEAVEEWNKKNHARAAKAAQNRAHELARVS